MHGEGGCTNVLWTTLARHWTEPASQQPGQQLCAVSAWAWQSVKSISLLTSQTKQGEGEITVVLRARVSCPVPNITIEIFRTDSLFSVMNQIRPFPVIGLLFLVNIVL